MKRNLVIAATSCVIPDKRITNAYLSSEENQDRYQYFKSFGVRDPRSNREIIEKLTEISGIRERRYMKDDEEASDLGARALLKTSLGNPSFLEHLDEIVAAHNFGDVSLDNPTIDLSVSMANKIKEKAGITNPSTTTKDIIFGCPGWLAGVGRAYERMQKTGFSTRNKRIALVAAEGPSRVIDMYHDINAPLFGDGAGAVILEEREGVYNDEEGVLAYSERSDSNPEFAQLLTTGPSYNPDYPRKDRKFLKMKGKGVYKYAITYLPDVVKDCLAKAGKSIEEIDMAIFHQANKRLNDDAAETLGIPSTKMPMTLYWLGNSSVATIPTVLNLVLKGEVDNHRIRKNALVLFASVGEDPVESKSMNCNAMLYRFRDVPMQGVGIRL